MNILHIFRSEPEKRVDFLYNQLAEEFTCTKILLYDQEQELDYDSLVQLIFQSDKIICWW